MSFPTSGDTSADIRADLDLLNSDDGTPGGEESGGGAGDADDAGVADVHKPEEDEEDGEGEDGDKGEEGKEDDEDDEEEENEEDKGKKDKKEDDEPTRSLHRRPSVRDIKTKYPEFFKDFPDMRHMLFREGEYSQLFPTVEDAREASTRADSFDHFSQLLNTGTPTDFQEFLKGVSEAGNLKSMAINFLPALYNTDKDQYFKVTTPVAQSLIRNAYKNGKQSGNTNLMNSALHIAQFVFGDKAFATGEKSIEPDQAPPKDDKLERERQEFMKTKYDDLRQTVWTTYSTRMRSEIKKGLDPGGTLNNFTADLLVDRIMLEIGNALDADSRHMGAMNSLWKHAQKASFAGDWKDRLLTTYLSGARALMPAIRTRIRTQATEQQRSEAENRRKKAEQGSGRKEIGGASEPRQGGGGKPRSHAAADVDWSRTSDEDFLNDKVTLRKRG